MAPPPTCTLEISKKNAHLAQVSMEGRQAKTPLDLLSKDLSAPKPMKQLQGHPSQPLIYDESWIPMNPS